MEDRNLVIWWESFSRRIALIGSLCYMKEDRREWDKEQERQTENKRRVQVRAQIFLSSICLYFFLLTIGFSVYPTFSSPVYPLLNFHVVWLP